MSIPLPTVPPPIDAWLDRAHAHLQAQAPDLTSLLSDYVGEARFGAAAIADDLAGLAPGARILEVGAGAGLLSAALQAAGYAVTALEPVGVGFSHMDRLRSLVRDYAGTCQAVPDEVAIPAEHLQVIDQFDFAFSINVMEHVGDVAAVLRRVLAALVPGAGYRFVCPNYGVPYEPHFGIPTLGSKALTWRVFERWILASPVVVDPVGTWASLNWISVTQVRALGRRDLGTTPVFDRAITYRFLLRAMGDPSFQRRHGVTMRLMSRGLHALGALRLALLLPAAWQPAMSCLISRPR